MIVVKLQIYHASVNNYFILKEWLKCFANNNPLNGNTVTGEGRLAGGDLQTGTRPAGSVSILSVAEGHMQETLDNLKHRPAKQPTNPPHFCELSVELWSGPGTARLRSDFCPGCRRLCTQ